MFDCVGSFSLRNLGWKPAQAHRAVALSPCSTLEADPVVEIVRSVSFNVEIRIADRSDQVVIVGFGVRIGHDPDRFWDGTCGLVESETDVQGFASTATRPRPPGNPSELDHYRVHEINSASHVDATYFPLTAFGIDPSSIRQNPLDRSPVFRADLRAAIIAAAEAEADLHPTCVPSRSP